METKGIKHKDGYQACIICEHEEIYADNEDGMCNACRDDRPINERLKEVGIIVGTKKNGYKENKINN